MFNSSKRTNNTYNTFDQRSTNQQEGLLNMGENAAIEGAVNISNGVVESNTEMRKTAEAAFSLGSEALDFGENAMEIGGEVVNGNTELSMLAIGANGELTKDALNQGFEFGTTAIESNDEALQTGFGFAESLVQQNTANTAANTRAMKELAKSVSTGGASDIAGQSIKTVYTIGGVTVAVVIGLLLIKGGK